MKIGYLMQAGVPEVRQPPFSGPAWHVRHVIDALRDLGHDVTLLALYGHQVWKSTGWDKFTLVEASRLDRGIGRLFERGVRRLQSELHLPYLALFSALRFSSACRQELGDADLLYERMGWLGYGGGLAAGRLGLPLILEVNGDHLSEMEMLGIAPRGLQRALSTILTGMAARKASHVVATGAGWRERFIDRWQVDPNQVTVIENGSELAESLTHDQIKAFQVSTGADAPLIIAYLGAFEPWHGVGLLVQAFAEAYQANPCLRLVLIGSGSLEGELRTEIQDLGLEDKVRFTGQLSSADYAFELSQAEIGVAPYCGRVEYSGLKLIDYKAAGLAIIASGEHGQPAVLEHGRTGWVVPPCDVPALRAALIRLTSDKELRKRIGRQARIEAETLHRWQHTAKHLETLFSEIVS